MRRWRPRRTCALAAFALGLAALGGCGGAVGPPLVDTERAVATIRGADGRTVPAPVRATITFRTDGTFGGSLGCNGYSGRWDGHARLAGGIAQTEMACLGTRDWAELAAALAVPGRVTRVGSRLTVVADTGARVVATPTDVRRLIAGRTFTVDGRRDGSGAARHLVSSATLVVAPDGRAYGGLDCGAWTGDWDIVDGALVVRHLVGMHGGCDHPDRIPEMAALLATPLRVDVVAGGRRLWLTAPDGRALGVVRLDRTPSRPTACHEPAGHDVPGFVGMDLADATALATRLGVTLRLVCHDGHSQIRSADLRPDRVNLILTAGRIERAYAG